MRVTFHPTLLTAALGLAAGVVPCGAQNNRGGSEDQLAELRRQNETLQRSLAAANRGEREAREQLDQVRVRLEALGKNLLDGGNDRLVQAAADLQIADERIAALEAAAARVVGTIQEYVRLSAVSDPDARVRLETSLRELDAVLGLRQKPRPDVRSGSLQQARVVSVDSESGMLVLNVGESQGAKIGMTFGLTRGAQPVGKAILADVRKGVSGLFIESLVSTADLPRTGDQAILETQPLEQ
ncbi:MAG: hypothetical protein V4733_03120 [Verrucomicrobiota bacterium]